MQTAERSSHLDPSENVIFQRHMIAYKQAAKLISGTVLEIGCGEGYGISELAQFSKKYIGVDAGNIFVACTSSSMCCWHSRTNLLPLSLVISNES